MGLIDLLVEIATGAHFQDHVLPCLRSRLDEKSAYMAVGHPDVAQQQH